MRIAYLLVDPGIGVFGSKGASVHVQEIVRAFRLAGHEVVIFCTRTDDLIPADLTDVEVHCVPVPRHHDTRAREEAITAAADQLTAAAAGHHVDLVYERYSLFSSAGADLADRLGIPLVVEVNAPLVDEQRRHRHLVAEERACEMTARLLGRADLVVCVSEVVAAWVRASLPLDGSTVTIVPNGVNTSRVRPGRRDDGHDRVVIGFVGTLKPWHGTDLLLRAAPGLLDAARIEICGTGPEQPRLEALADELGITEHVRFHGAVPPSEVPNLLRDFDIAVAPYPPGDHYFSPLKVYEYLAAGLPVVASAIGSLPELLHHGEVGVLVPPGDPIVLASALRSLVDDPGRRAELGHRARRLAVAEHSWQRRCRDILEQLDSRTTRSRAGTARVA